MHDGVFRVEDVHNLDAVRAQRIGDHRAMTAPPNLLRTLLRCALCSPASTAGPGRERIPRSTCSRRSRERRRCAMLCSANRAKHAGDHQVPAASDDRSPCRPTPLQALPCHTADISANRRIGARRRLPGCGLLRAGRQTPRADALNDRSSHCAEHADAGINPSCAAPRPCASLRGRSCRC
jgi:hypothetical protein